MGRRRAPRGGPIGAAILVAVAAVAVAGDDPTIHELAEHGDPARIARVIQEGVPVDVRDAEGRTALHVAAEHGHLFAVMMLIGKGADPNARDRARKTPLHLAARGDDRTEAERFQIVKVLLAKGADPKARDTDGKRPVDYATRAEFREILTTK